MDNAAVNVKDFAVPTSGTAMPAIQSAVNDVNSITKANNAQAIANAQAQRDWQASMVASSSEFNAREAAKNRNWQEYMSNTAHQREVRDLLAAGLNPILSAMNGNGASVTSGATASAGSAPSGANAGVDESGASALVSLLGTWIAASTQMQQSQMSALTSMANADKANAMSQYLGELNYAASMSHADATKYAAGVSAAAQRYGYDINAETQRMLGYSNLAQDMLQFEQEDATKRFIAHQSNTSAERIARMEDDYKRWATKYGAQVAADRLWDTYQYDTSLNEQEFKHDVMKIFASGAIDKAIAGANNEAAMARTAVSSLFGILSPFSRVLGSD